MNFSALAQKILSRPCKLPVRLIGVDGGAGAGKTTFTDKLARALGGPPVIPMDDFNAFDDLQDYWPRFESQILAPLFAGRGFRYQKRDWVNDIAGRGLNEWRELPFAPLILFEGVGGLPQGADFKDALRRLDRGSPRPALAQGPGQGP